MTLHKGVSRVCSHVSALVIEFYCCPLVINSYKKYTHGFLNILRSRFLVDNSEIKFISRTWSSVFPPFLFSDSVPRY
jgi:hypothetical protein